MRIRAGSSHALVVGSLSGLMFYLRGSAYAPPRTHRTVPKTI